MITSSPLSANRSAISLPIPRLPPVTKATLFFVSIISFVLKDKTKVFSNELVELTQSLRFVAVSVVEEHYTPPGTSTLNQRLHLRLNTHNNSFTTCINTPRVFYILQCIFKNIHFDFVIRSKAKGFRKQISQKKLHFIISPCT